MKTLDIAMKDILQVLKDRKSVFFLVLLPLVFTLFFGFVFSPSTISEDDGDGYHFLVIAPENEKAVEFILDVLDNLDSVSAERGDPVNIQAREAEVADGSIDAILVVPEGYSESLMDAPMDLEIIMDPESAGYHGIETVVRLLTGRLNTAALAAETSVEFLYGLEEEQGNADGAEEYWLAFDLAIQGWQEPSVSLEVTSTRGDSGVPSGFAQSSPGMIVQFAVFGLISAAMLLVLERKNHALDRMLSTPTTRAQIILGHILGMFAVIMVQELVLITIGEFLFGVDYSNSLPGTLLMAACLAMWAASLGLAISAFSETEDQVLVYSLLAMFIFSALGGAWFPLDITGKTFSAVGHLLPTAWAMDGFQNIIIRGLGVQSVLLPVAILLGYAVLFFGLAVWRFNRITR